METCVETRGLAVMDAVPEAGAAATVVVPTAIRRRRAGIGV